MTFASKQRHFREIQEKFEKNARRDDPVQFPESMLPENG